MYQPCTNVMSVSSESESEMYLEPIKGMLLSRDCVCIYVNLCSHEYLCMCACICVYPGCQWAESRLYAWLHVCVCITGQYTWLQFGAVYMVTCMCVHYIAVCMVTCMWVHYDDTDGHARLKNACVCLRSIC
jgi:hypothetical protein